MQRILIKTTEYKKTTNKYTLKTKVKTYKY